MTLRDQLADLAKRRAEAERLAKLRGGSVLEVIIHDETAESLKHLFLPPDGSHVTPEELRSACVRLVEATRAMKRLAQNGQES